MEAKQNFYSFLDETNYLALRCALYFTITFNASLNPSISLPTTIKVTIYLFFFFFIKDEIIYALSGTLCSMLPLFGKITTAVAMPTGDDL